MLDALSILLPCAPCRDTLPGMARGLVELLPGWRVCCEDAGARVSDRTDQDLRDVAASLDGDGEAYRRIVRHHQDAIAAMMWRFSRDPETHAELVQDVFVEAYTSLHRYRAEAPLAHWLARIATHTGYRFWKRQSRERRHRSASLDEWTDIPEPARESDPREAAEIVHRLLERLSPRDRLIVTLRYLEEKSVEETARLTGMSQTMVKVQAWRARGRLRKLYESLQGKGKTDER